MQKKSAPFIYPFNLEFDAEGKSARFPFYFDGNAIDGISCAISGRAAGDMGRDKDGSADTAARKALFDSMGIAAERVFFPVQSHSRTVAAADEAAPVSSLHADGMVSGNKEYFLSVTVADCLPVFLFDTESSAFGLVHSGWKGTGIAFNALKLMTEKWQTRSEAVAAVFGPCIRSCCYRVDEERAAAFESEFGGSYLPLGPVAVRRTDGVYLDMQAANAGILAAAGIRNIAVCRDCTFTGMRLGSFRREGTSFTRMAALCGFF